ncbi:MAG: thiamine-monophosphate kinase [Betaproteobacteria bacterium]|nr:thiamine-monophosphate kinase [Betaproteobacteria bacterium]
MSAEFDLIQHYFSRPAPSALLGVGDDAALLQPTADHCLAVSSDTLVAGIHFFSDADPFCLGWKALAVNLSDLAAMGATPRWVTLALTLPHVEPVWLERFSAGLYQCAEQYQIDLVGGDTTRGNLSMTLTVIGEVPLNVMSEPASFQSGHSNIPQRDGAPFTPARHRSSPALRRNGAQIGDTVWVSGELGTAALALASLQNRLVLDARLTDEFAQRLHRPVPRVALGIALRGIAHSAIDISDGLVADLGHLLQASGLAGVIDYKHIPMHQQAAKVADKPMLQQCALSGGDDYELCFTAPASATSKMIDLGIKLDLKLTAIGYIEAGTGLRVRDDFGRDILAGYAGYDHFQAT